MESFSPSDSSPETEVSFEMPSKGNKTIDINFEDFCHELWCHCQYDVACIEAWSLKREWADFSKLFLSTLRPTSRSVKGLYDYFRRNKSDILTHINILSGKKNVQVERKDEENGQASSTVYFPNLTTIQNSVVLVNSSSASISAIPCQREKGKEIPVLGKSLEFDKVISSAQNIQESPSIPKASLTPDFDSSEIMEVGNNISALPCQKEVKKTPLSETEPQSESGSNTHNSNHSHNPLSDLNRKGETDELCSNFCVEKEIIAKIDDKKWHSIFSKPDNLLSYNWSFFIADLLSEHLPNCCVNFKRRKVYPSKSIYVSKYYFYCSIAGCNLNSTATISKDKILSINNRNTTLVHKKGEAKSYQSRYVRGDERMKLGKCVADSSFPSKEYHKRLSNLDEKSFSLGNLKDTPASKNVVKQCSHEYRNSLFEDKEVVRSIQLLKSKYNEELKGKSIMGFIQFFSVDPFIVALWTEQDIELYHRMSNSHSLLVDATGSIVPKKDGKEVFYFAYISYDRSVKTEPVAHIELFTELSTTHTLKFVLSRFLEDEMKRYNYTTFSIPLLCTTDFSWPIIKSLIEAFNNESIEEYLARSFSILSGKATSTELPSKKRKTFLHISLCHVMKAFSNKVNEHFKVERSLIKYVVSLLANSTTLFDSFDTLKSFFKMLLSKYSNDCIDAKNYLEDKASTEIESLKVLENMNSKVPSEIDNSDEVDPKEKDLDIPICEEEYLQQSKRSIFFKKCKILFKKQLDSSKPLNDNHDPDNELNIFYSPAFANYFLNNWCGILPLWTSLHLGDQGRHGTAEPYSDWSQKYSQLACVINPPKTQGLVEFHHKSVKHISLNSKRDRIDKVISNLYIAKRSKHRQFTIALSKRKCTTTDQIKDMLPKKLASETWAKRPRKKLSAGPGIFQTNLRKNSKKGLEEWEKLSVISWGGDFIDSTDSVQLINTCTLDNILQILYTFYALNIHQTRKIFESDHDLVKKISELLQLLLTESFVESKVFWLSSICNLSPTINSGVFDIYGTDKQISFFHIRHLFRRSYHFQCSSYHCPSNLTNEESKSDHVSNMTLHLPNTVDDISIEASIREWEEGTSQNALVSCKEIFVEKPSHEEFIVEMDQGEEVVRCSGWRNFIDSEFVVTPPFLIFELSARFTEKVKDLGDIPKHITVYGESYQLGGLTSFIPDRSHYVAFILMKDEFLLYDDLPKETPVLKKYRLNYIRGEVSLLCYFPVENDTDINSSGENFLPNDNKNNSMKGKNIRTKQKGSSSEGAKDGISSETKLTTKSSDKDTTLDGPSESIDDALLAKALHDIENEKSPVSYDKPRGKNYRCRPKGDNLTSTETVEELQSSSSAQRVLVSELIPYLHFDRDVQKLSGKGKKYMTQLWCDLLKNGLKYPLSLSVSKKTGRAVIFDGNHRLTLLRNKKVKWVPLEVLYFFIEDDYDESFPIVPHTYGEDEWPSHPTPEKVGFMIKKGEQ